MYSFLFRNKLGALAFVVLTMISAATLVGTENHDGVIVKTTAELTQQLDDFAEKVDAMSSTKTTSRRAVIAAQNRAEPESVEFTPDDDLIDSAQGFDPTPEVAAPDVNPDPALAAKVAEEGEVVIILNNERYTE